MSSSSGVFATRQRNTHQNARPMLKRRIDNRGGFGDFQGDGRMNHNAPPQKRARSQTQTQFPLYHHDHGSNINVSRVSNYGDVNNNSSNRNSFALRNNDSYSQSNVNHQKPNGYLGNPNNNNPQLVPLPLPYRNLDDTCSFDALPEWNPNQSNIPIRSSNTNREITDARFSPHVPYQAPVFTNFQNSMPMNNPSMVSVVSQAMPQRPIISKELCNLLSVINNANEKQNDEAPLGLDFDPAKLKVRHEAVIKSLYSDMPRQCTSCGVRFKCQEDHSKHMDWHVRKNRMMKEASKTSSTKPKKSRDWFASTSLWLSSAIGGSIELAFNVDGEAKKSKEEEEECLVVADENQKTCALCIEPFEEFFSHEADDWMYKDTAYLNKKGSGPIVHVKCMPEPRKGPAKETRQQMVMPVTVPSVASALVC